MTNSKGQFWSLDLLLAAVLFTLALGVIVSNSELWVLESQESGSAVDLQTTARLFSNALVSKADIIIGQGGSKEAVRCQWSQSTAPRDISWVENCLVNPAGPKELTPESLGFPSGKYGIHFEDVGITSSSPELYNITSSEIPTDRPYISIERSMLASTNGQPTVAELWDCMAGSCPANLVLTKVTLTVWRLD
jgi:hypothetical protein